jgi:hypothetical protein
MYTIGNTDELLCYSLRTGLQSQSSPINTNKFSPFKISFIPSVNHISEDILLKLFSYGKKSDVPTSLKRHVKRPRDRRKEISKEIVFTWLRMAVCVLAVF